MAFLFSHGGMEGYKSRPNSPGRLVSAAEPAAAPRHFSSYDTLGYTQISTVIVETGFAAGIRS